MAAATSISINDATPTAHVFNPVSVTPNLTLLRNTADANTSATEEQIGLSLSRANANRATNRIRVTLSIPYEQTVDGAVVARSIARAEVSVTLPDDMSSTERGDFGALLSNAIADAEIQDYITDLEPMW